MALFLLGRRFILRREREDFAPQDPLLFNTNSETGAGRGCRVPLLCVRRVYTAGVHGGCTYQCIQGGHVQGGIASLPTQEAYTGWYRLPSSLSRFTVGHSFLSPEVTTFKTEFHKSPKWSKDTRMVNDIDKPAVLAKSVKR